MATLKLKPRLVPEPLWGISASRRLKASQWQQIRRDALDAAGAACEICGAARPKGMVCDEEWGYEGQVATLTGSASSALTATPSPTSAGRRFDGFAEIALQHMARVNDMTIAEAIEVVDAEVVAWQRRSRNTWHVEVAPLLLARYPVLAVLMDVGGSPGEGRARFPG